MAAMESAPLAEPEGAPVAELEGTPVAELDTTSGGPEKQAVQENVIFPQSTAGLLEGISPVEMTFEDDRAAARYELEGRVLLLECTADAGVEEPEMAADEAVNREGVYETKQGYTYRFSEEGGAEAEELKHHASVTVGAYTLSVDFSGFTKQEAAEILESIDLSLYE